MTKVDEYINNKDYIGRVKIRIENGEVYAIDEIFSKHLIGKIEYIKLAIEQPEELIGIYRIESVVLLNKDKEELFNDQHIVDNVEYHDKEELVESLAKSYGVSKDIIKIER